jgi:hypothetical protein
LELSASRGPPGIDRLIIISDVKSHKQLESRSEREGKFRILTQVDGKASSGHQRPCRWEENWNKRALGGHAFLEKRGLKGTPVHVGNVGTVECAVVK